MRRSHIAPFGPILTCRTDFTALTIFEQFKKESTTTAVERVLKKLAESKAKEILTVCFVLICEKTV